jgi:hypothetical protein
MMDRNAISDALYEIHMMVEVLMGAQEGMQAPDNDPSVFQVRRADGEMISFAAVDIHRRVTALRDALDPPLRVDRPSATIIPIGGNECS